MPIPDKTSMGLSENMLIAEELAYDKESLKAEHETLVTQFTNEQKNVYDSVMHDIDSIGGGLFFVYGYGGTSKTFVWKTLSSKIMRHGDIVLNIASNGIASLLLPRGRTTHSKFVIPLSLSEDCTCNISQGSDLGILDGYLAIKNETYPNLVKEFYRCMVVKKSGSKLEITSKVNGVKIVLNENRLAKLLKLTLTGVAEYKRDTWIGTEGLDHRDYLGYLLGRTDGFTQATRP
ncbi:PREDICTED: uncharacterized protein LOC109146848 [Ipomoea nil]|uniref:uncharacterized protein LOC109146848 n=1 Tax=Ipomoea nil TaxID=35883 RepID=UPI0009009099|nr:PREDICTED: uncharacterized protein LOC109146848 [Ipomoea nil]